MTPLKPLENRRVRGVPSERYPLNEKCSHPECSEKVADPHHCFPRSQLKSDSWFVSFFHYKNEEEESGLEWDDPIPHVTGLCRAHHDDVEQHRAWIKLEDGVFVWYDRIAIDGPDDTDHPDSNFLRLGPLNPQPGSREGKPKRRRHAGKAARTTKTWAIRAPDDAEEDGMGLLKDAIEKLEEKLGHDPPRPPYWTLMDALNYALLHMDETDV